MNREFDTIPETSGTSLTNVPENALWGFTPHTPWCFSMVIVIKALSMRQPINNPSRVPAYLRGRKSTVSAFSCVEPSNIGEGRVRVDVSWFVLCARE